MKKFLVIIAVLALTMISSVAMADVTFDGSIEFLMRSIKNTTDWNDKGQKTAGDYNLTYERLRFGVNAKNDGVKGRIQFENDWDAWGDNASAANPSPGFEAGPSNRFYTREAWLDFTIPGAGPAHVKVGRQFLQLGNGWFLRSGKYGSDAWLIGRPDKTTVAFVNIKASDNNSSSSDDTDAYSLIVNHKIDDSKTVGLYLARAKDRQGVWTRNAFGMANAVGTTLDDIGLWFNGKLGPVNFQAQFDIQQGELKRGGGATNGEYQFEGTQWVLQGNMPVDAATVRATLASGSGEDPTKNDKNLSQFVAFLDKDPRYTLVYEYYMVTAAGAKNTGFSNTMAIGLGGDYKINKMFTVGLDYWMLSANEKVNNNGGVASDDVGAEIDLSLKITLYDQLTWNTWYGVFQPGGVYKSSAATGSKADDATAVHSVMSYKF